MAPGPEVVGAGQFLAALIALLFFKPVYDNRETTGATEFGVFLYGTVVWSLGQAAGNFTGVPELSLLAYQGVLLGAELTAAGWFLTAVTVTRNGAGRRRVAGVLIAWLVVMQGLIWTNSVHHLVLAPDLALDGVVMIPQYRAGFWVHTASSYFLVVAGTSILGVEAVRSTGLRRKQMALLSLASVPFLLANVVTLSELLWPVYDLSPFGYLVSAVLFGLVLLRGRFLDITTVARSTAMSVMDDAVITLDKRDRVIDCNRAARTLFDVDGDYHGMPAAAFFESVPASVLSEFEDETKVDTEITVPLAGSERHFALSISPVAEKTTGARVIVLSDITLFKQREKRLRRQNERLDEFASVVSHDLQNPLGLAQTYLDFAEESGSTDDFEAVREAHERMNVMIEEMLTMARAGQTIDGTEPCSLHTVATEAWNSIQTDWVTLDNDLDDERIEADRNRLRQLLENLFRNSVEHGLLEAERKVLAGQKEIDFTGPRVRIGPLTDAHGFYIADNGTGLPDDAAQDLFAYGVTTSDDGTGLGLAIVADIVAAHGWTIEACDSETGGARFEIRIQ